MFEVEPASVTGTTPPSQVGLSLLIVLTTVNSLFSPLSSVLLLLSLPCPFTDFP